MSFTIWKETLVIASGTQEKFMPMGAQILTVREQETSIAMWYHCNPDNIMEKRRFIVIPTGSIAPTMEGANYLGTAQIEGGKFIFHVFEIMDIGFIN